MAVVDVSLAELHRILRERFGYESFRPGQERIIRALLDGRDVMAVLPTGAGKSLTYQLTSQVLPGTTLVVSPLIALMKDQMETLTDLGVEVGVINSALTAGETAYQLRDIRRGAFKLLYVTPERFSDEDFMAAMKEANVSLFVVDEAHCVSEWGHDFRPDYLVLGSVAQQLGRPPVLALTATATPWLRAEIMDRLGLRSPELVVRGIDRPNLFLEVCRVRSDAEDRRVIQDLILGENSEYGPDLSARLRKTMQGSGIIYAATRQGAAETAEWLNAMGISSDYYHGQRKKADRDRVQEAFMAGDLRVISATNAFGLGVDKPDVRFVIHRDIPTSLEAYYQEAGRAGRDGDLARCTLIYRAEDLGRAAFMASSGQLTREEVRQAQARLKAWGDDTFTLRDLKQVTGLSKADLGRLVTLLKRDGILGERRGRFRVLEPDFDPNKISLDEEDYRRAYERSRIDMMRGYVETRECRRIYILNYFGEEYETRCCSLCDNDIEQHATQKIQIGREEAAGVRNGNGNGYHDGALNGHANGHSRETGVVGYSLGQRVVHNSWGEGTVQRVSGDVMTVLFETAGYKTLSLAVLNERGILRKAM
ncbi:MAG: RecQ family ATP-dependent DNA helicase [Anaerolineae bacterium]